MIYLLIDAILCIIAIFVYFKINTLLRTKYYKKDFLNSGLGPYENIHAVFSPEKYIAEKNFKKGYAMQLLREVMLILSVILVAILFAGLLNK
jgi:hypothetical protein